MPPTEDIISFVRHETGDDALAELFAQALKVHLGNPDELKGYAALFPRNGIGVAQGSSLSAFAGNVLLFDMDQELNAMPVTCIRYIDDLLMVSTSKDALAAAVTYAGSTLSRFNFSLYTSADGPEKAAAGECANAIDFLGCTIQPKRCSPSAPERVNDFETSWFRV